MMTILPNKNLLSTSSIKEAKRYNTKLPLSILDDIICPATVLYKPRSRDFAVAIAIFQHNNRLMVDGKLGPDTRKRSVPRLGGSLYLSRLPRLRSGMDVNVDVCIDNNFVTTCKESLIGRIKLLVCGYNGTSMTKRPGDFFGLDGTTLGWPHFAASTLRHYIEEVYHISALEMNFDTSKLQLLDDKGWREEHIKDAIHNGGLFAKPWWRRLCIIIANNKTATNIADTVWYDHIFKNGLTYWYAIGLQSELGLAVCVRFRNSGSMPLYVRKMARKILKARGEAAAIKYIQSVYTKDWTTREKRVALMNSSFSVTELVDTTQIP